ncbi:MAG: STAS domain-containing protein [bacterium]
MNDIQVNLRLEDRVALMDLQGSVTALAEKKVLAAYERAVAQKTKLLLLNFSAVNYINSAGMAIIITLLHKAQAQGGALRAFGLTPHFQKIFEMVGLLKHIPHFKDESEARAFQSEEGTE